VTDLKNLISAASELLHCSGFRNPSLQHSNAETMLSFQTERVRALFDAELWNVALSWTFKVTHYTWWSRDSLVSVATKRCVEQSRNCGPICDRRKRFFSSPKGRHRLWGLSSLVDCHFVPGLMRLGLEFDHLPPSSTDVKNKWNYSPTRPYGFRAFTGNILLCLLRYASSSSCE
jgi:hypothetical protein